MSLRCVGNQSFQTAPSPLLAGASTVSLSLWVRVNPGCDLSNPAGAKLFGDGGGKLSATLAGPGNLKVGWSSNDGHVDGGSAYAQAISPGVSSHLAVVWRDGAQQYYLDGTLVHSDTQRGSVGLLGDSKAYPFQVGSDSPGSDVTLDEPTIWVGHALTAQEVVDLRDRAVRPAAVAPASIALHWSLAGPDGVAARVGDAGLADSSASGLALASIVGTAPTYIGGNLVSQPPGDVASVSVAPSVADQPAGDVASVSVAPSGTSIVAVFHDASGNPSNVTDVRPSDDVQTLNLIGLPSGGGFTLGLGRATTAKIPTTVAPPTIRAVLTKTISPGTYTVGAYWDQDTYGEPTVLLEVFDGATRVGSATVDMSSGVPSGVKDGNYTYYTIGTFTFANTSLVVRSSAPPSQNRIKMPSVRIAPAGGGPATIVAGTTAVGYGTSWFPFGDPAAGVLDAIGGSGAGDQPAALASDIQAALGALSSVGAGNVTVAGSGSGPFTIHFAGTLSGLPQGDITATDPAVGVTHTAVGGQEPTISVNGGPPIHLTRPTWGVTQPAYLPFIHWILPQSAPAVQHIQAQSLTYSQSGSNPNGAFGGTWGVNGGTYIVSPDQAGDKFSATYPFHGLPAATYQVSVTYIPGADRTTKATCTVVDDLGTTLATYTFDQTTAPADFTAEGVPWKILGSLTTTRPVSSLVPTLTNAGTLGTNLVADTIRLARTSADTSVVIKSTDNVTFSAPAGYASTAAGAAPAAVAVPVTNKSGGSLVPFSATPKTMKVGWDIQGDDQYLSILYLSSLHGRVPGIDGATSDANHYPTVLPSQSNGGLLISFPEVDNGGSYRGQPGAPAGTWTLTWDGACLVELAVGNTGTCAQNNSLTHLTGTTNNVRAFDITESYYASPQVYLTIYGTTPVDPANPGGAYHCDLQNLRIYPPGVDPANPGVFHPDILAKLSPVHCIRGIDSNNVNDSNIRDYDDLVPETQLGFGTRRNFSVPILSVTGYTGTDKYHDATGPNGIVIQFTTASQNVLFTGLNPGFGGYNAFTGIGTATLSDGTTLDLDSAGWSSIRVLSPTTFLIRFNAGMSNSLTMTNTLTPTAGTVAGQIGVQGSNGVLPFTLCVALANATDTDFWVCIPTTASDACIQTMATYVAAHLKAGLKLHVEYSNETWNTGQAPYYFCTGMSAADPTFGYADPSYFYVKRSAFCHAAFTAAFVAAGRPAADVRKVFGTQAGYFAVTDVILGRIKDLGVVADEIATAPYYYNDEVSHYDAGEPTLGETYDLMTTGQLQDRMQLICLYGNWGTWVSAHVAKVRAAAVTSPALFGSTEVVCYEGSANNMIPSGGNIPYNVVRYHAVTRDPRYFNTTLAFLQLFQDSGATLFNWYFLGGGDPGWTAYPGTSVLPGTGDPAHDPVNVSDPTNLTSIKSQVGGAINRWASLVGASAPRPMPFGRDLFGVGSRGGRPLAGSTASDGMAWTLSTAQDHNANNVSISAAGRAFGMTPGYSDFYLPDTPPSADYPVGVICDVLSVIGGQVINANARSVVNVSTCYQAQIHDTTLGLYLWLNGAYTQIGGTVTYTPRVGHSFLLMVNATGPAISAYLFNFTAGWVKPDGTFQPAPIAFAAGTDSAITAAGLAGMGFGDGPGATPTTGIQIREFNAGKGFFLTPGSVAQGSTTRLAVRPINQLYNPASPPTISATSGTISTPLTLTSSFAGSLGYRAPASGTSDTLSDGSTAEAITLTPSATGSKKLIPGRNGQLRTTGFPRGLYRTTR